MTTLENSRRWTEEIKARVPPELKAEIERVAMLKMISASDLVRMAVGEYLSAPKRKKSDSRK